MEQMKAIDTQLKALGQQGITIDNQKYRSDRITFILHYLVFIFSN